MWVYLTFDLVCLTNLFCVYFAMHLNWDHNFNLTEEWICQKRNSKIKSSKEFDLFYTLFFKYKLNFGLKKFIKKKTLCSRFCPLTLTQPTKVVRTFSWSLLFLINFQKNTLWDKHFIILYVRNNKKVFVFHTATTK